MYYENTLTAGAHFLHNIFVVVLPVILSENLSNRLMYTFFKNSCLNKKRLNKTRKSFVYNNTGMHVTVLMQELPFPVKSYMKDNASLNILTHILCCRLCST